MTTHRRIERPTIDLYRGIPDNEHELFQIDAGLLVKHLNTIKPTLLKTKERFWDGSKRFGSWRTRTEYHARILTYAGNCVITHPYSTEDALILPIRTPAVPVDFQIDVMILLKVLRTFKKERPPFKKEFKELLTMLATDKQLIINQERVTILVTDKQLIIRQDRNRVAINFVGVKNV